MRRIFTMLLAVFIAVGASAQGFSKELEKKAKNGDSEAMIAIGNAYATGNGIGKDAKKAKEWYEKAKKNKNAAAYEGLADLYRNWDGLGKDPKKVCKYTVEGARAGNVKLALEAARGYMQQEDGYFETNPAQYAFEMYCIAADAGDEEGLEGALACIASGKLRELVDNLEGNLGLADDYVSVISSSDPTAIDIIAMPPAGIPLKLNKIMDYGKQLIKIREERLGRPLTRDDMTLGLLSFKIQKRGKGNFTPKTFRDVVEKGSSLLSGFRYYTSIRGIDYDKTTLADMEKWERWAKKMKQDPEPICYLKAYNVEAWAATKDLDMIMLHGMVLAQEGKTEEAKKMVDKLIFHGEYTPENLMRVYFVTKKIGDNEVFRFVDRLATENPDALRAWIDDKALFRMVSYNKGFTEGFNGFFPKAPSEQECDQWLQMIR